MTVPPLYTRFVYLFVYLFYFLTFIRKKKKPANRWEYRLFGWSEWRDLNGPDIVAVPLKMAETIRVGLVVQGDVPLSSSGQTFVAAIRSCCARRSSAAVES